MECAFFRTRKLNGVISRTVTVVIAQNLNQNSVWFGQVRTRYPSIRTWAQFSGLYGSVEEG